jgi:hypothetical protein
MINFIFICINSNTHLHSLSFISLYIHSYLSHNLLLFASLFWHTNLYYIALSLLTYILFLPLFAYFSLHNCIYIPSIIPSFPHLQFTTTITIYI